MHTPLDPAPSFPEAHPVSTPPDIFTYSDYRAFLADWFTAQDGRPSQRGFARRARCSPSLITGILKGRNNLDAERAERFAAVMKLAPDEAAYFLAMVRFAHAFSREERQAAWDSLVAAGRFHGARSAGLETFEVFSRWHYAAIAELASCEGFQADPAWIAATLRPNITEAEAAEALELLLRKGLLQRDAGGGLRVAEEAWRSAHEVFSHEISLAITALHEGMLERAAEALVREHWRDRHFSSTTIAIPSGRMEELKELTRRYEEQVMHLCMGFEEPPDRVVNLALQLFPLSERTGEL